MQLKSFEISKFKSIIQVKCYVSPKITVLAGKNESGKTNILEALEKLNKESMFKEDEKPLHSIVQGPIIITFYFQLSQEEINQYSQDLDIDPVKIPDEVHIRITNEGNKYEISGPVIDAAKKEIQGSLDAQIPFFEENLKKLNEHLTEMDLSEERIVTIDYSKEEIEKILKKVEELRQRIQNNNIDTKGNMLEIFNSVIKDIHYRLEFEGKIVNIESKISSLLPQIILFNSFDDILPSEVLISEVIDKETLKSKHKIVKDFVQLSGLDVEGLKNNPDRQTRANITNKASKVSSDLFGKFWNQDPIEISVRYDEPLLSFFIQDKEEEKLYKPQQRSKGLQWFTAFLMTLTAESINKNNLILVDEPGLYLHAKAQEDVLGLLEELSDNNQVIFTTHSPYLIDTNDGKLARVRLILKDKKTRETKIENNFNKGADIDTLTPIITAIGLDLSKGISFSKKMNILIEGVSDYYYLQAILNYLKKEEEYKFPDEYSFIPCVGNTKIGTLVSLLIGWGVDYKILFDKKGTNRTYRKLIDDGIEENKILFVGEGENDSIENLFSHEDVEKYKLLNSELSKTITSKIFFEKVAEGEDITFAENTLNNFKKLFENLKSHKK
jgi:predicted ATPase